MKQARLPVFLSKSKIMSGAQCAKRLWLEVKAPERAEVSPETQRSFAVGHAVGAVARTLFPGGVLIGHDQELAVAIRETEARLEQPGPVTLFEATVRAAGVLVRADILERDDSGRVRLVEVKASTSVKPHYIDDCAIQTWVLEAAGRAPARVELAHVNNGFVYPGGGKYEGLLTIADVTGEVQAWLPNVEPLVGRLWEALRGDEPAIAVGPHCLRPYECPFLGYCSPPAVEFPLSALPGGGKTPATLAAQGIKDIREIPAGTVLNDTAEWVRRVTVEGRAELRPEAARKLAKLAWPRYYFDFETVRFAVPVWEGTRPYQALPFQWSCHIEQEDGSLRHLEFLAEGQGAPMRACAESLLAALGEQGPVIVYTDYERGVLSTLAGLLPDLAPALERIIARLYDLHAVTKRNYYHPKMLGSWSLKAVLPTVAPDLSYESLKHVSAGGEAEEAFLELLRADIAPEWRAELRGALLEYCALDTLALVRLARFLAGALQTEPG